MRLARTHGHTRRPTARDLTALLWVVVLGLLLAYVALRLGGGGTTENLFPSAD
jgi:hypothetical protein